MRTQAEQVPQGPSAVGVRQFNAFATSSANSFLPIPSSPTNNSAPGKRPASSIRFSTSLTRSLPAIFSNILSSDLASSCMVRYQQDALLVDHDPVETVRRPV